MPRLFERARVQRDLDNLSAEVDDILLESEFLGLRITPLAQLSRMIDALRNQIESSRYVLDRTYRRKARRRFDAILSGEDTEDRINDDEFLFHYRMTRSDFSELVKLLEDNPVFRSHPPTQAPPAHQILVLLKYLGTQGNQASNKSLSKHFGIGAGTAQVYRDRALLALLSLESETYFWPDEDERQMISQRIKENYYFPNCVGIADGTLLPLAFRPALYGEHYLDRKRRYSLTMLIVCDEQCRILYIHLGWPGSVHDNRVWRNCILFRKPEKYFGRYEYLLGDSAYNPSLIMIPAFKAPGGGFLDPNKSAFNDLLTKPRVKSEHTIGLLKGRFPFLRDIRMRIRRKGDLQKIINYVKGTVILHNLLTKTGGRYNEDWIDRNEFAGIDDDEGMSDLLDPRHGENGQRRERIMVYFSQTDEVGDRFY